MDKVLVQVIDVFNNSIIKASTDGDVVENRQMLNVLAQADTTSVRTNRHAKLRRHQYHCHHLVHAAQAATIDLAKLDCARLHQLFEHHTILTVFASRHSDRCDGAG